MNYLKSVIFLSAVILFGCKKESDNTGVQPGPCANVSISISTQVTNTNPCINANGQLSIIASGSNNYSYSIDGGQSFQSSSIFSGLSNGSYSIVVKNADGCSANSSANITTVAKGPQMTAVQNLIVSRCYPCHNTGGLAFGSADLSSPCAIISKWDRIKARAVDNTPTPMPYSPLPASEKAVITNWVNGGHGYEN